MENSECDGFRNSKCEYAGDFDQLTLSSLNECQVMQIIFVNFLVIKVFNVSKLSLEKGAYLPFSCRGPKVVLLKLILSFIKRLIGMYIRFL